MFVQLKSPVKRNYDLCPHILLFCLSFFKRRCYFIVVYWPPGLLSMKILGSETCFDVKTKVLDKQMFICNSLIWFMHKNSKTVNFKKCMHFFYSLISLQYLSYENVALISKLLPITCFLCSGDNSVHAKPSKLQTAFRKSSTLRRFVKSLKQVAPSKHFRSRFPLQFPAPVFNAA